ncbi:MAG: YraN family protein [Coriobacteriales bacterium]|jgi:putative endonuclease|nr:YraN family protein [Coriobacteriales bacterium]
MTKEQKQLGQRGEGYACHYLERQGVRILERNWRCKAGEADIIACEDEDLVFIEVKTRRSAAAGLPEEAVTPEKRKRYEGIALHYLATHSLPSSRVRFDVIALSVIDEGRAFVRHHRDAFCCE